MKNTTGYIFQTESFGAVDGPGIRYVFFLQGCPMRCIYCHNPESHALGAGSKWTAEQALNEVLRYKNFIKDGGVTLSGGEPLMQPKFVTALLTLLKEAKIHTAIDTSGGVGIKNEDVRKAIDLADMLIIDAKAADDDSAEKLTSMTAKNTFETLDYCEKTQKRVWVRHVLLRGYTDNEDKLHALAKRLSAYQCIELIEIIPFHKLGEHKWQELSLPYLLAETPATTKAEVDLAKDIFKKYNLPL